MLRQLVSALPPKPKVSGSNPTSNTFFCTFFAWHVHALLTSTTTMMDHELNAAYVALADHVSDGAPCHGDPPRLGVRPCDGSTLSLSIA